MKANSSFPKVKVLKNSNNMYRGYLYDNEGNLIEKTSEYMNEVNCITWTNKRVDYYNETRKLNLPHYKKETRNETAKS